MKYVPKRRLLSEQAPCAIRAWVEEPGRPTDRKLIPECRELSPSEGRGRLVPVNGLNEAIVFSRLRFCDRQKAARHKR